MMAVQIAICHARTPASVTSPWEMIDETYTMADAGEGSEILLTTDHAKSMKTLGWMRQYKNARCLPQSISAATELRFRSSTGLGYIQSNGENSRFPGKTAMPVSPDACQW